MLTAGLDTLTSMGIGASVTGWCLLHILLDIFPIIVHAFQSKQANWMIEATAIDLWILEIDNMSRFLHPFGHIFVVHLRRSIMYRRSPFGNRQFSKPANSITMGASLPIDSTSHYENGCWWVGYLDSTTCQTALDIYVSIGGVPFTGLCICFCVYLCGVEVEWRSTLRPKSKILPLVKSIDGVSHPLPSSIEDGSLCAIRHIKGVCNVGRAGKCLFLPRVVPVVQKHSYPTGNKLTQKWDSLDKEQVDEGAVPRYSNNTWQEHP